MTVAGRKEDSLLPSNSPANESGHNSANEQPLRFKLPDYSNELLVDNNPSANLPPFSVSASLLCSQAVPKRKEDWEMWFLSAGGNVPSYTSITPEERENG